MSEQKYGNAAAIGFIGFGLATVLLAVAYAGGYDSGSNAMLLGMFIFIGGFAEVVAGAMLWKMGDTFASLAFTAFGFFWLSLATIYIATPLTGQAAPNGAALGAYLFMWGLFAGGMAIGALKAPRAVMFLLAGLSLLFFLLAAANWTSGDLSSNILKVAGYWGVIDGFSGVYISLALVINESLGREIIPLFVPKPKMAKAAT